jgi:2-polyprenyl-3-methyl-5-hydroxy-6-metoxy-1,4-benzoquinol methylase
VRGSTCLAYSAIVRPRGAGARVLNSDPVLWTFAGDVNGLTVLDAGCGTGYLSKKLRDRGALVTGIDFSERMIEIARTQHPDMDFRVDSCSELTTIDDGRFDLVIANYVLMDTPHPPISGPPWKRSTAS